MNTAKQEPNHDHLLTTASELEAEAGIMLRKSLDLKHEYLVLNGWNIERIEPNSVFKYTRRSQKALSLSHALEIQANSFKGE